MEAVRQSHPEALGGRRGEIAASGWGYELEEIVEMLTFFFFSFFLLCTSRLESAGSGTCVHAFAGVCRAGAFKYLEMKWMYFRFPPLYTPLGRLPFRPTLS